MELTPDLFRSCTGATQAQADFYYPHAMAAMDGKIDTPVRVSAFLANVAIETGNLRTMEEDLYYKDAERIAKLYLRVFDTNHDRQITPDEVKLAQGYTRNAKALSQLLYKGYHGRGALQLTGEANYRAAAESIGYDYLGDKEAVAKPEHCFVTAVDYFLRAGGNDVCDDFKACVKTINPALIAFKERNDQFDKNITLLA